MDSELDVYSTGISMDIDMSIDIHVTDVKLDSTLWRTLPVFQGTVFVTFTSHMAFYLQLRYHSSCLHLITLSLQTKTCLILRCTAYTGHFVLFKFSITHFLLFHSRLKTYLILLNKFIFACVIRIFWQYWIPTEWNFGAWSCLLGTSETDHSSPCKPQRPV